MYITSFSIKVTDYMPFIEEMKSENIVVKYDLDFSWLTQLYWENEDSCKNKLQKNFV